MAQLSGFPLGIPAGLLFPWRINSETGSYKL